MANETVLQELHRRWPWTEGLQGEKLAEAIAMHQQTIEDDVLWHLFIRLAMFAAAIESPAPAWSQPDRFK